MKYLGRNKPQDTVSNNPRGSITNNTTDIYEPEFGFPHQDEETKRISSIVKLVEARDPINKYFESTVNLANKDAWRRRSIYLSKAQAFDPQIKRGEVRNTVTNTFSPPKTQLSKDDSTDDELWDNVDEGIGEYDRVIPSIAPPKCMAVLIDRFLPAGISNLLRNSTRFSRSFHVGGSSKKDHWESSYSTSKFMSRIGSRGEESKNTFTTNTLSANTENTAFFGYQKNTNVQQEEVIKPQEDNWNFTEEKWVREKTLQEQKDTLKDYENDEIKNMGKLQGQEVI